jgi:Ca-activated chloride channel family protein
MLHKNRIIWIALLAMALLLASCSSSAEKLNGEGNQAFLGQAYQDALAAYQGAQIENPELAEPYYNAANALYREGNYEAALEQLQHALSLAGNDQLAENNLYNIGNNFFNIQDLQNAIEAYKQALLIDPEDQEAKYNLELALQQQEQQEQEQQQEQNQEEQQQDQDGSEGDDTSEEQSDDSQNSGDTAKGEKDQSGDQTSEADEQNEQDQQQDGEPKPGDDNQDQGENSSGQGDQSIQPGARMTEEQAKQLLAAIANDMETLQEKLGKILFVRGLPPLQDW